MASQAAAPAASAPAPRRACPASAGGACAWWRTRCRPVAATPPPAAVPIARPTTSQPQTLGVTFLGAASDGTVYPPDTMGAAGPTQFLVGINGRIRTFSKATGAADGVLDADMDVFFASVRNGSPTAAPRVRYDRLSSRWFVTITTLANMNNRILIAVSDAASAGVHRRRRCGRTSTSSTTSTLRPATAHFFDSASLGVDANERSSAATSSTPPAASREHGPRRPQVHAAHGRRRQPGGRGLVRAFRNLTGSPSGPGPYTPQGVDNLHDAAATESWVVGRRERELRRRSIFRKIHFSATGAWPPDSISPNLPLTVPATAFPLSVPHLGNALGAAGELDALDDRLSSASLRAGRIWTAHNVAVDAAGARRGDRDGSRWYEVDVSSGSPVLAQAGTLFDSAGLEPRFFWIPAIMVSGQGHAAIGSSAAGATERINAATAGRLAGDPAGPSRDPSSSPRARPTTTRSSRFAAALGRLLVHEPRSERRHDDVDDPGVLQRGRLLGLPSSSSRPRPRLLVGASPASVAWGSLPCPSSSRAPRLRAPASSIPAPGFPGRLAASVTGGVVVNR